MFDENINFWTKFIESSPAIVILLISAFIIMARGSYIVIKELLRRLDDKDERLVAMQRETLVAIEEIRKAVNNLTEALKHGNRYH